MDMVTMDELDARVSCLESEICGELNALRGEVVSARVDLTDDERAAEADRAGHVRGHAAIAF
jgi:hypothetical protein